MSGTVEKPRRSRLDRFVLLVVTVLAVGCGSEGNTSPNEPVASVTLDRTHVTLTEGEQTQLVATPRDAQGKPLSGREVTWGSSDETVASVTAGGLVTAHRAETATITATSEGRSGSATVVVAGSVALDLIHSGKGDVFAVWRLYVTPLDGGPSRLLLPADVLPEYGLNYAAPSPDGRRVAFTGYEPDAGVSYIFVADVDGSSLQRLTAGGSELQPAWSPDGSKIAYVARPQGQQGDIWVMDADGGNPVNLTGSVGGLSRFSPAWSPSGSRIVFGEGNGTYSNLWTMRPDGSDRIRVTNGTQWMDDDPSWSPDGTRITFMRAGPGTEDGFDIWVVDAAGTNAASLVKLPQGQGYPEWSPDGRWIAFNSAHAPDPEDWFAIYTVRSDGTQLTRRTYDPWMSIRPAWQSRK